ncbi:MAG: FAD-dependent oxidoreductase, partial [Acidobacteriaceae bacterium]|nr:FAD-dependent oxidoreductase [Acidobacteriaceae bacterium]
MTVLRNDGQWDRSNVAYENGRVVLYDKRGGDKTADLQYIDYGFSVLRRDLIAARVPSDERSDLADLFHTLSLEGQLAGFQVYDRFYEIGSIDGWKDFENYVQRQKAPVMIRPNRSNGKTGILGGGLAGLTVAAHLEGDCEVLEADERPGGHCQSVQEDGFTYDAGGPHIMFSRNQRTLDFMVSLLGDNVYRGRRNNKIFYKGRYVKYPFENGLNELEPQDRFECLYHYLKNDHPAPSNFKDWMYHTFGTGLTEKYLLPYNEKIWKVAADQMSLDWVEGRVPKPPIEDVIKSAVGVETEGYTHQLYFYYPLHGGIESLPCGMAKRVANITTAFHVRSIRRTSSGWVVSNGQQERVFERLVSTMPIHEMAEIVEGVP